MLVHFRRLITKPSSHIFPKLTVPFCREKEPELKFDEEQIKKKMQ